MKVRFSHLVSNASEGCGPIVQFMSDGFVFVGELINCTPEDFKEDKEYTVDVKFFCHHVYGLYSNAEDFQKDNEGMAEESYIPVGAFPADPTDKSWEPSPMNWINSTVKEIVDSESVGAPDFLILFEGSVNGLIIDQVIDDEWGEYKDAVTVGTIVSGLYWAEVRLED